MEDSETRYALLRVWERTVDSVSLVEASRASVGGVVLGLRRSWRRGSTRMPVMGLPPRCPLRSGGMPSGIASTTDCRALLLCIVSTHHAFRNVGVSTKKGNFSYFPGPSSGYSRHGAFTPAPSWGCRWYASPRFYFKGGREWTKMRGVLRKRLLDRNANRRPRSRTVGRLRR
jgi:hypothetical protein